MLSVKIYADRMTKNRKIKQEATEKSDKKLRFFFIFGQKIS